MSTADKSYNSGFSIKFPLILDNFSDIRQLDIFDSKLTVWEDYIVGIQLLITGKAPEGKPFFRKKNLALYFSIRF